MVVLKIQMGRSATLHGRNLSPSLLRVRDDLASFDHRDENGQVEAVVGILLWDEPGKGLQTLLVQRAERDGDPWSGQIGLPGGRIKRNVESPRGALHREVEEEVGIKLVDVGTELGSLSVGHPMRQMEMGVQPWIYGLWAKPKVSLGDEIASSFWVNLPELPSRKGTSQITIRDWTRNVEAFIVDGKVVWGYTYRVLTELLPILKIPI
jgi:8-oxo-dGTP pyrophosphatase MutT (NUDIX family)